MNQRSVVHQCKSAQLDHLLWANDIQQWRADHEEALRALDHARDWITARDDRIQRYAEKIAKQNLVLTRHERQRKESDTGAHSDPMVPTIRQCTTDDHSAYRSIHAKLKSEHATIIALLEVLDQLLARQAAHHARWPLQGDAGLAE